MSSSKSDSKSKSEPAPAALSSSSSSSAKPKDESDVNMKPVELETYKTWEDMKLDADVLRALYSNKLEAPRPIQRRAIAAAMDGRHMVVQAPGGSGKTLVFAIAAMQRVNWTFCASAPQVVVVVSSRELATEQLAIFRMLGSMMAHEPKICLAVGGATTTVQNQHDLDGAQIVIGTPGRLSYLARTLTVDGHGVKWPLLVMKDLRMLIFDEVDQLLQNSMLTQVTTIYRYTPETVQIVATSATMPVATIDFLKGVMVNPLLITLDRTQLVRDELRHYYVDCDVDRDCKSESRRDESCFKQKLAVVELLCRENQTNAGQTIVFCATVDTTRKVAAFLRKEFDKMCVEFHGHLTADERKVSHGVMTNSAGVPIIIVTTDLAARGLDTVDVGLVILFNIFPAGRYDERESFYHKIHRAGRGVCKGVAVALLSADKAERTAYFDLQNYYAITFSQMPIEGDTLGRKRVTSASASAEKHKPSHVRSRFMAESSTSSSSRRR